MLRNGPHKGLSFLAYLVRVLRVNDGLVLPTERTKVLVNDAGTIVCSYVKDEIEFEKIHPYILGGGIDLNVKGKSYNTYRRQYGIKLL